MFFLGGKWGGIGLPSPPHGYAPDAVTCLCRSRIWAPRLGPHRRNVKSSHFLVALPHVKWMGQRAPLSSPPLWAQIMTFIQFTMLYGYILWQIMYFNSLVINYTWVLTSLGYHEINIYIKRKRIAEDCRVGGARAPLVAGRRCPTLMCHIMFKDIYSIPKNIFYLKYLRCYI